MLEHQDLTERIIGVAIELHRKTGPGLLESVYAACICFELEQVGLPLRREVTIPVFYKGKKIPLGFRADILVANALIPEIKAVPALLPAHDAQLQTYLRLSGLPVGLLLKFPRRQAEGRHQALHRPRHLLRGPQRPSAPSVLKNPEPTTPPTSDQQATDRAAPHHPPSRSQARLAFPADLRHIPPAGTCR
jgi:GxxExxY protein